MRNTMINNSIKLLLIIYFLAPIIIAQDNDQLRLNFDFGYAQPNPDKLQEVLIEEQKLLNLYGVNVKPQRNFDFDINYGISVLYQITENISIGLGGSYLYSDAYLLYGDVNGSYDASGKIKSYSLKLVFQYLQPVYEELSFIGELVPNYNFIKSEFKRDIKFFTSPQTALPYEMNRQGNTFGINILLGISYNINSFEPYLQVGYRYLFLEKVDISGNDGIYDYELKDYEFKHDLSGIIFKIGLSYSIEM